jgi:hypothetical protein
MVLLLSGVAWALEGIGVGCSGGRGERQAEQRRGVNGRRRKEELLRRCAPLKATRGGGRWLHGGGNGGLERWQQSRGCGQGGGLCASVWTVRLTGGPHEVLIFFQFIQIRLNFKNSKWVLYVARLGYYEQFS